MPNNIQAIFISGRFRSGSSFLWQLFDDMEGFCAWYEPLHPQLLSSIQHVEPKKDHVGIRDYWTAYRKHPQFDSHYQTEFSTNQLYMEATDDYPELERYIRSLIQLSAPDIPVLQFNRVDLRLAWLHDRFPEAKIIHIERNPMQLYHSQRKHIPEISQHDANYWDAYELLPWCYALSNTFPFLLNETQPHAFYRFYILHQLSSIIGNVFSDVSINLDQHVFESEFFVTALNKVIPLTQTQQSLIKSKIQVPEFPLFDETLTDSLAELMTEVDLLLNASGLAEHLAQWPLKEIKSKYSEFWSNMAHHKSCDYSQLLSQMNVLQTEMTRILAENNRLKQRLQEQLEKPIGAEPINLNQTNE